MLDLKFLHFVLFICGTYAYNMVSIQIFAGYPENMQHLHGQMTGQT